MIMNDGKDYKYDHEGHRIIFEDDGYRYHAECPRRLNDVLMHKMISKQNEEKIWEFSLKRL